MKRYGDLWQPATSWQNLLLAAKKALRGKRHRPVVQRFEFRSEWELLRLHTELLDGSYTPGPFTTHKIYRPKERLISAAPYRDRVVHHAVMNVLEPIYDRHFHPDSYACRKGKGTHAAIDRLQGLMKCNRYLIACDVRKFFPSIDHEILKSIIRRRIKDRNILRLLELIVDSSNDQESPVDLFPGDHLFSPLEHPRGLPLGNLTSQWLANLYLDGLDHFVTSHLGIGAYVRYCDDFIFLGNDREQLCDAMRKITEFCNGLRLKLHVERSQIRKSRCGVTFLGFRVWPTHRFLRKDKIRQFRRRLKWMKKAFLDGRIDLPTVRQRIAAWLGHAMQGDSLGLIRKLLPEFRWFEEQKPNKTV